jgi:hypothetical protein
VLLPFIHAHWLGAVDCAVAETGIAVNPSRIANENECHEPFLLTKLSCVECRKRNEIRNLHLHCKSKLKNEDSLA